jgi:hypothetical protein
VLEKLKDLSKLDIFLFGLVGVLWLALAQVLGRVLSHSPIEAQESFQWILGFWALCVLDLLVLRKLISIIFQLVSLAEGNRLRQSIQALCWGVLKVLCLGLFIVVLLKGQKIPMHGLLLGIGTLGVIPVFGGLLLSQRVCHNA